MCKIVCFACDCGRKALNVIKPCDSKGDSKACPSKKIELEEPQPEIWPCAECEGLLMNEADNSQGAAGETVTEVSPEDATTATTGDLSRDAPVGTTRTTSATIAALLDVIGDRLTMNDMVAHLHDGPDRSTDMAQLRSYIDETHQLGEHDDVDSEQADVCDVSLAQLEEQSGGQDEEMEEE
ncbi:Hypothetical protein D9617_23g004750 [Elsinoe fawcettii]|nr:Hypothetical protein D9617_23g004750 [Elsinoe fawcettii]